MGLVGEEVVVLGDVGDDAQPVGHFHGHHVLWVQQGWDSQLRLSHLERLKEGQRTRDPRESGENKERSGPT